MPLQVSYLITAILSYALGCFSAAYYLTRLCRKGADIRELNSGNAGATNAGRVLGKWGFAAVFLLDFIKGAGAVGFSLLLCGEGWGQAVAVFCAVAGHNWPVQLGFHGGRGISTAFGGFVAMVPLLSLGVFVVAAVLFLTTRKYHLSGIIVVILFPLTSFLLSNPLAISVGASATAVLLLIKQRQNILRLFGAAKSDGERVSGDCDSGKSKEKSLGEADKEA